MRSIEEFKQYVYDKADDARVRRKRCRRIELNVAASLSVFVVCIDLLYYYNVPSITYESAGIDQSSEWDLEKTADLYSADYQEGETQALTSDILYTDNAEINFSEICDSLAPTAKESMNTALFLAAAESLLGSNNYSYYSVAEDDASYTGELSDVDFDNYVAVTVRSTFVSEPKIQATRTEYTEGVINLTLVADLAPTPDGAYTLVYTVLLDREEYTGQTISIQIIQP